MSVRLAQEWNGDYHFPKLSLRLEEFVLEKRIPPEETHPMSAYQFTSSIVNKASAKGEAGLEEW